MVYVLSYLCLLAATLSALTPVLPPMFVTCAPVYNSRSNLSVSTVISVNTTNNSNNQLNLLKHNNSNNTQLHALVQVGDRSVGVSPTYVSDVQTKPKATIDIDNHSVQENSGVINELVPKFHNSEKSSALSVSRTRAIRDVSVNSSQLTVLNNSRALRRSLRLAKDDQDQDEDEDEAFVDDTSGRNERSTNLSHITGTSRKIQMYVTNRYLQILADGTVNGTGDDTSIYTILQRIPVKIGQLRIQGIATCQYLCIDACGLLYGSRDFNNEDCVFNEMIEHNHYNTYSSAKYSNKNRTMYLALNRRGQPRKVLLKTIPGQHFLGKMATYTRVLTKPVLPQRVDELETELLRALRQSSNPLETTETSTQHPIRHHGSHQLICPPLMATVGADDRAAYGNKNGKFRCRKRKKRKKKRRKQTDRDSDTDSVPKHRKHCSKNISSNISSNNNNNNNNEENPNDKSKEETETTTISEIENSTNISRRPAQSNQNMDTGGGGNNRKQKTNQNSKNNSNNVNNNHKTNNKKHTFVFTFNGESLTNCDAFKNVNKHRKCEEALRRQRAKAANFHLGEVDVSPPQRDGKTAKRRTPNVAPNRHNRNTDPTTICKHHNNHHEQQTTITSTATTVSPVTIVESVFGDALASSSPKYTVNTDELTGDTDTDDWGVTASSDDGSDATVAVLMFTNHKVPQTPVPPPYNELDEFDDDDTSSILDD